MMQRRAFFLALLLGAALGLAACEESVDPILDADEAFTLYGFFDARSDTQAVRVFLVEDLLAPERPDPLDAEVFSQNLGTGQQVAWRDSTVRFPGGRFGHVFWATFRVEFEHTYRLTARRADGAEAQAEVTVPPRVAPEAQPPEITLQEVVVPIFWRHAPRLNDLRVVYDLAIIEITPSDTLRTARGAFTIDYGEVQEARAGGVQTIVLLRRDRQILFNELRLLGSQRLVLCGFEQRVLVSNAEWTPPGGVFDPEVLVEPGTFSNVEGGFGFVGAGYEDAFVWTALAEVAASAGYVIDDVSCE